MQEIVNGNSEFEFDFDSIVTKTPSFLFKEKRLLLFFCRS